VDKSDIKLPFEPLNDEETLRYDFQWRSWNPPRTPECRTGRGDTTLFSFMYFYYIKHLSFADAATYTATLVEAKMQVMGGVNDEVVKSIEHLLKKI
jgi:hypothetical protein